MDSSLKVSFSLLLGLISVWKITFFYLKCRKIHKFNFARSFFFRSAQTIHYARSQCSPSIIHMLHCFARCLCSPVRLSPPLFIQNSVKKHAAVLHSLTLTLSHMWPSLLFWTFILLWKKKGSFITHAEANLMPVMSFFMGKYSDIIKDMIVFMLPCSTHKSVSFQLLLGCK